MTTLIPSAKAKGEFGACPQIRLKFTCVSGFIYELACHAVDCQNKHCYIIHIPFNIVLYLFVRNREFLESILQ